MSYTDFKYIKWVLVVFLLMNVFSFCSSEKGDVPKPIIPPARKKFFVSPDGSDLNPGTKNKPWQSFGKVAEHLNAGDTAVFENGEYYEKDIVTFKNSGKSGSPIVVKARNKHKAKIIFPAITRDRQKINIVDREYIEIRELEITQVEKSSDKTSDIFIRVSNSTGCSFIGNKIYFCLEEGIKISGGSKNMLIKDNEISDTDHEGIDVLDVENVTIEGNRIYETGRVGIMVKGGARNIKVFNNIIENKSKVMRNGAHGITIGGVTDHISTFDNSGYEAYNVIVWNNVVIAKNPGKIDNGISFIGAKNCHVYNNVIINMARAGILISSPNAIKNKWTWNPTVVNPRVKNNIIMNVSGNAFNYNSPVEGPDYRPENPDIDYNLYYNIKGSMPTDENNSIYSKDPLFYDLNKDWRLSIGSPAFGKGIPLPDTFSGYENSIIKIDFHTFDNIYRGENWNIGVY